jgi:enoyl-CoA hydratase/carnithine racemase
MRPEIFQADLTRGDFSPSGMFGATDEPTHLQLSNHRDGGGQVVLAIHNCRKVVIGAINGPAVGVGATMTLGMDIRLTWKGAKMGFVFVRRGELVKICISFKFIKSYAIAN